MKSVSLGSHIAAAFIFLAFSPNSFGTRLPPIETGTLRDPWVVSGCGCHFAESAAAERRNHYVWAEDFEGNAWINIDGRDLRLRSSDPPPIFENSSKESRLFSGSRLVVHATYRMVKPCPPEEEECEVSTISIDAEIKREGYRTGALKGEGLCGC